MTPSLRPWALWITLLASSVGVGCDSDEELSFDEPGGLPGVLPSVAFCDEVRTWDADRRRLEAELLERINAWRADGADCGAAGRFAPAPALRGEGAALCAARVHAVDMASNDFVAHAGSDESTPWARLREAGARFSVADQVLAAGALSPTEIVDEVWMTRASSCAALMAAEYRHIGVGWAVPAEEATYTAYVVGMVSRDRATPLDE